MLYYEKMEKDILEIFDKFQKGEISLDDLKNYQEETYRNNITYGLKVDPEDNYNFLRAESTLPNSFYEATITLIPKPQKDPTKI